MITSLGPSEFADGLGLGVGEAVVVGLGVGEADGGGDGLVATGGVPEVGEKSEAAGLAWPHATVTIAQKATPVARHAVIRCIDP